MLNLVIFGPPGAGKGTQSEKLIERYQLLHISTGNLFRDHIKKQTALGQQVSRLIADGELVPDSITIAMLEKEVEKNPQAKGYIFDGFPRTVKQAQELDRLLASKKEKITGVIALEVDQLELTHRIAERHKSSGRPDDDAQKLKKRIEEYFNKTILVLPYYQQQNKLVKINGIGEIDTVFANLCKVVDGFF